MSSPVRIALVGATGLIGQALIRLAVGRDDVRLVAIARREVRLPPGARMEVLVADPAGWGDAIAAANATVLVCALGTTWKAAGKDEVSFRAIDKDLVLECARAAKAAGIRQMIVVSSIGASTAAKSFYLRTKGETEDALAKVRMPRLDILRPGLLRGKRGGERRSGERLAILASPVADLLLHGSYRKYRSINDRTMARAILFYAHEKAGGRFVHDHDALIRASRRLGD